MSKRQKTLLGKKIIEYFFSHPYANSTKQKEKAEVQNNGRLCLKKLSSIFIVILMLIA